MFRSALRCWSGIMMLSAPLLCVCLQAVAIAEVVRLQADDWVTECDTAHETSNDDCSIIGVFRDRSRQGIAASFSLLADLRNKQLTVVGDPPPTSSRLQVDKMLRYNVMGRHIVFSPAPMQRLLYDSCRPGH
jgi:hypothetical protein